MFVYRVQELASLNNTSPGLDGFCLIRPDGVLMHAPEPEEGDSVIKAMSDLQILDSSLFENKARFVDWHFYRESDLTKSDARLIAVPLIMNGVVVVGALSLVLPSNDAPMDIEALRQVASAVSFALLESILHDRSQAHMEILSDLMPQEILTTLTKNIMAGKARRQVKPRGKHASTRFTSHLAAMKLKEPLDESVTRNHQNVIFLFADVSSIAHSSFFLRSLLPRYL